LTSYGFEINHEEIESLISQIDTNNNGFIDYTEFIAGCMKSKIYLREDNLKQAFQYFDKVIIIINCKFKNRMDLVLLPVMN